MTIEKIIASLEKQMQEKDQLSGGDPDSIFTKEATALYEAIRMLRTKQTNAKLDRSRWEGCSTCNNTPGIMLGEVTMCIGKRMLTTESHEFKFCPECGKPLTEEAWAEMERRIGGNDGTTD